MPSFKLNMEKKLSIFLWIIFTLGLLFSVWYSRDKNHTYTLYRNDVTDKNMRIHIATFDAADNGNSYNEGNCKITRDLFQNQDGITIKFWCEPSYYHKKNAIFR